MPDTLRAEAWDRYLLEYHDTHPGITEDVLANALDSGARSPYHWLAEAVPAEARPVVDLGCGSGPLCGVLGGDRVVGIDRSVGELVRATAAGSRLVRADAMALPIADCSVDAVAASMALMLLRPLETALTEIHRVLRPGGTLVATLPIRAASPGPLPSLAFAEILRTLGQIGADYPEPLRDPVLADRFAAAGLRLEDDATETFARTVRGPDDAERVVRGFYAPGTGPAQVTAAIEELQRRVRSAPVGIAYRIRRLVAVR